MTQEILNTLSSLAPFRVVVENSTAIAEFREEDGQLTLFKN